MLNGCSGLSKSIGAVNTTMQNAVDSLDRGIAALSQQSADWRIVVQDLEKEVSRDMQSHNSD